MTENIEDSYPVSVKVLLSEINTQLKGLKQKNFIQRFNQHDASLWSEDKGDHAEIAHRLAWLDAAVDSSSLIPQAEKLLEEVKKEGFSHAVVLGMGGSSLAPEVYSQFFEKYNQDSHKGLSVSILDSTSPEQIIEKQKSIPLGKTLFIVSSKSGTTVEVKTLLAYFWKLIEGLDPENPGKHFIAISDPGTQLQELAVEKKFRKSFKANPNVGGRYSALIAFGIVPAVLAGFDGEKLLKSSGKLSSAVTGSSITYEDKGAQLGLVLGSAYLSGRDKLTILSDAKCNSLGSWIEQLVAESSGKNGRGILPVDKEPLQPVEVYGQDRMFVYLREDGKLDERIDELISAGQPVYICQVGDMYDLGAEFYRWEVATAIACIILEVNAFDQPNVQESKDIAKRMINTLKSGSSIESSAPVFSNDDLTLFSESFKKGNYASVRSYLNELLITGKGGSFIGINAFVSRDEKNEKKLQGLRKFLTEKTSLPTTLGFGPRFLHSTGQLHKGGQNNGLFIVISQDEEEQLDIPGEGITFNDLLFAQALGDTQALEKHQRRVIRLHFSNNSFQKTDLTDLFDL